MKMKNKSLLWTIFLAIFSVNMLTVIVLCVLQTQNNLPASKMLILPIAFICMWLFLYYVLHKMRNFVQQMTPIALPVFLFVYGLLC